tara:strand:+ start:320 stop:508 length:189 start_codon:yes stop_codon:yes gene_type:complete
LPVEILLVIAITVAIGVVPLRWVIGEGIGEASRMGNPEFGWVRIPVPVNISTAQTVKSADPP